MAVTDVVGGCLPDADTGAPYANLAVIDRIGTAFCESARDTDRVEEVQQYRSFRMRCLKTTLSIVDACDVPIRATMSVRLKRLDSIRRKIGRVNTNFSLGRLDDVVGVRVVCEDLGTVRGFSKRIQASPHFYRLKDYISEPAHTGYRGINHILRFRQPVTEEHSINMRFEVQVRTYLQHQWAVWSESHGEAVKLGTGVEGEHENLRRLSREIDSWEAENRSKIQTTLPHYSGGHSIAVCWRVPHGPVTPHLFMNDAQGAVTWLNYLEMTYPADRANALLLVGVADVTEVERLLQLTHPLFTGNRVIDPVHWMQRIRGESLQQGD